MNIRLSVLRRRNNLCLVVGIAPCVDLCGRTHLVRCATHGIHEIKGAISQFIASKAFCTQGYFVSEIATYIRRLLSQAFTVMPLSQGLDSVNARGPAV